MAQVLDITGLLSSAQSPDASTRNAAEAQLASLQENQYPSFLLSLAAELSSAEKPVDSRRLAGLVLKNALDAKDAARQAALSKRWMSLDGGVRSQIKQLMLTTLGAQVPDARHTAALAIAKIAAIEIPHQAWPELIDALLQGAGASAAPGTQQAALESLGYVCEELGLLEQDYLEQGAVNRILTAVVGGMSKNVTDVDVRLAATVALNNALEFARKNFESEAERNYIMQCVCENTIAGDVRVRQAAWECLVSIAMNYYETLPAYMGDIFTLTQRAVRQDDERVALQALEFWCSICEEEVAAQADETQCHGFIRAALPQLVPLLLEQLTKQDEDAEAGDEGAWNISMAAGTCLGLCASAAEDAVVPLVMPYVQANIQKSDEWRAREAATFAFGSMLEGPSPEALHGLVAAGLPFLLAALKDPNAQVKNTTAWTIGRTLEFVHGSDPGNPLVGPGNLPQIVQALLEAIQDAAHVAEKVCYALSQLADGFADPGAQTTPLSPYFQTIIQALLQTAARPAESAAETARLQIQAFEAINEVVRAGAADTTPLVAQLVPLMVSRLQTATVALPPGSNAEAAEKQAEEQGLLCGVIQVLVQRLSEDDSGREAVLGNADAVASALLAVFACREGTVHEEAMLAMGALTYATGRGFAKYLPAFFPILERGIVQHQELQVCQVSIGVVGDVCRAVEEGVAPYADRIMTAVLTDLGNAEVDRKLKPPLLSSIGDVALALGAAFEPYLPAVCAVLQGSMVLSAQLAQSEDEEMVEYNGGLRHAILEAWAGMLNGLPKAQADTQLHAAVPAILDLVESVARDPPDARDVTVWKAALALLGDVAATLSGAGKALSQRPALSEFVEEASRAPALQEVANWASQVIGRALRTA